MSVRLLGLFIFLRFTLELLRSAIELLLRDLAVAPKGKEAMPSRNRGEGIPSVLVLFLFLHGDD